MNDDQDRAELGFFFSILAALVMLVLCMIFVPGCQPIYLVSM